MPSEEPEQFIRENEEKPQAEDEKTAGTMPRKVSGDRQDQLQRTIPAEREI